MVCYHHNGNSNVALQNFSASLRPCTKLSPRGIFPFYGTGLRVYHITKLYFSYAIFVTYLIQFYVPMDFLEPPLTVVLGKQYEYYKLNAFRTILVIVTGT